MFCFCGNSATYSCAVRIGTPNDGSLCHIRRQRRHSLNRVPATFSPHASWDQPPFRPHTHLHTAPTHSHTLTFPFPCNSRQHAGNEIEPRFSFNYSMLHTPWKTITVPRQPGEIKAWSAPGESMIKSHTYLPLPGPIPERQMKTVGLLSNMPIRQIKPSWVCLQEWDMATLTNTHTRLLNTRPPHLRGRRWLKSRSICHVSLTLP